MQTQGFPSEWIEEELRTVDLGDQRLDRRMVLLMEELGQHPQWNIHAACSGHNESVAAYRFFDHPRMDEQKVLAPHRDATLERVRQEPRVLLVQDTTELDFSGRDSIAGAGPLSREHSQGFHLHPLLAVTPGRLCLGTLWLKLWARTEVGLRGTRRQRPLEQKESHRWLEGYRAACAVARQCPQTQIICVQDSEADIYELLAQARAPSGPEAGPQAEYVVRACQDRRTDGAVRKLWARVEASPVLGGMIFAVPRRGGQPARKVRASVRAREVRLRAPCRMGEGCRESVKVWAVLVRELHPPAGIPPVEWLLLSSLPVTNLEEALLVVEWYGGRWEIEIFFKVLKLGCRIERLQLETAQRLRPAFAFYMIVAWRILYVTMLGRAAPELSCAALFEAAEWKAVWMVEKRSAPPAQAPPLGQMIQLIARLGGYKARKGDGPPGPQVMWEGLRRVFDLALAWEVFGPEGNHNYV